MSASDPTRTYRGAYDPNDREKVLSTLRSEILVARLKVTLDNELGRESSRRVKNLSEMKLPPLVRQFRRASDAGADGNGPVYAVGN